MKTHLRENTDPVAFVKAVRDCKHDVWMETEAGDRLDLKSVLSTYLFALMTQEKTPEQPFVIQVEESDFDHLTEYLHV